MIQRFEPETFCPLPSVHTPRPSLSLVRFAEIFLVYCNWIPYIYIGYDRKCLMSANFNSDNIAPGACVTWQRYRWTCRSQEMFNTTNRICCLCICQVSKVLSISIYHLKCMFRTRGRIYFEVFARTRICIASMISYFSWNELICRAMASTLDIIEEATSKQI